MAARLHDHLLAAEVPIHAAQHGAVRRRGKKKSSLLASEIGYILLEFPNNEVFTRAGHARSDLHHCLPHRRGRPMGHFVTQVEAWRTLPIPLLALHCRRCDRHPSEPPFDTAGAALSCTRARSRNLYATTGQATVTGWTYAALKPCYFFVHRTLSKPTQMR